MATDVDSLRTKRLLRARIARLRRRIDGRVHGLDRHRRRLTSWRTYVRRYPSYAVLAALGFGLTLSAGLGRGGWTRLVGLHLVRRMVHRTVDAVMEEIKGIWADSAPAEPNTDLDGADDGRS